MERTKTTRVTVQPECVIELIPDPTELESIDELGDFQFVYALAQRCLEHEALACVGNTARAQVGHLLDRLISIEWLVAE